MRRGLRFLVLFTGFLVLVLIPLFAQETASEILNRANTAYTTGHFQESVDLYESLISNGFTSFELYYNLGSAYFELDDLGRALLNFRRAYRLAPRDGDVNLALALIRALRVDIQGDDTALIDNLAEFTSGVIALNEFAWLAFGLWAVWFALVILWLTRFALRERLRIWLMITGILMVFGAVLFAGRVYVETARPPAVVVALQTRAMSGPGDRYLELFALYAAAEVRILEERGAWVRILLPDGLQGWLRMDAIERV